jgi:hypothetical protein
MEMLAKSREEIIYQRTKNNRLRSKIEEIAKA